ncbi:MAG: tRNA (adenosine(37)-N6)-dimethylallyltransferase MiaA [Clostridiales bacterium]|nr:tRNA (adenosine(37)-N6)-dimethylallyltransferase MiaA [Clostridiales bacterium]
MQAGKTSLSIKLAKKINADIISIDSMQVYKYMDIGTAKVTEEEKEGIMHHMIDVQEPDERFSVAEYIRKVKRIEQDILKRGKNIIIIGGTGLYVNSLIYGFTFEENDEKVLLDYRKSLEESIESGKETLDTLYEKAKKIDEKAADMISRTDKKRIFRILEIYYLSNTGKTEIDKIRKENNEVSDIRVGVYNYNKNLEYKLFYIDMDREILYNRINKRVEIMIELGLIEETKKVIEIIANKKKVNYEEILKHYDDITALQAIGYREVIVYLKNEIDYEEMKEKIKQNTRRYAKRQITWFKKNEKIMLDREKTDEELIEIIMQNI